VQRLGRRGRELTLPTKRTVAATMIVCGRRKVITGFGGYLPDSMLSGCTKDTVNLIVLSPHHVDPWDLYCGRPGNLDP
jgi:hypothetical protein